MMIFQGHSVSIPKPTMTLTIMLYVMLKMSHVVYLLQLQYALVSRSVNSDDVYLIPAA